jgi:hypothetical protein
VLDAPDQRPEVFEDALDDRLLQDRGDDVDPP